MTGRIVQFGIAILQPLGLMSVPKVFEQLFHNFDCVQGDLL